MCVCVLVIHSLNLDLVQRLQNTAGVDRERQLLRQGMVVDRSKKEGCGLRGS